MPNTEIMPGLTIGAEVLGNVTDNTSLDNSGMIGGIETYSMDAVPVAKPAGQKNVPIVLMTPDKKQISIYLTAMTDISTPSYLNALSLLLDNLPSGIEKIHMFLGTCVSNNYTVGISSILASMESCKCPIITYAYGMCSVPETMIWCYGHERVMGEYGCIMFGGGEWIKNLEKVFKPYIDTYMKKCIDIGVLDEEMVENITVKQKEYMFVFDPIEKKIILV